jgi:hypothetical protein
MTDLLLVMLTGITAWNTIMIGKLMRIQQTMHATQRETVRIHKRQDDYS